MRKATLYCPPGNAAAGYAGEFLRDAGVPFVSEHGPEVTHWLLPVPTREAVPVPAGVTAIGGNIPGIDLLKDPFYLAENAAITARCALGLIGKPLRDLPVLVLGWGRIGKCLGKFLSEAGADVTVAARRDEDVAMIRALGYDGIFISDAPAQLARFGAVINTVPSMVLDASGCGKDCVLLELASRPGMTGENIIDGRGLPGRFAPEESGRLIARRVLRLLEVEDL